MTSTRLPILSVLIVNRNSAQLLDECLDAVLSQGIAPGELEIVVVDDASTDGSTDVLERRGPQLEVVRLTQPSGFASAANAGIERARGSHLLCLNPDVILYPGALRSLLDELQRSPEDLAAVQPLILQAGNRGAIASAGLALERDLHVRDDLKGLPVALAPAAACEVWGCSLSCALFRTLVFTDCGPFDPRLSRRGCMVEFSLRAHWLGYRFRLTPQAQAQQDPTIADDHSDELHPQHDVLCAAIRSLPALMVAGQTFRIVRHDLMAFRGHWNLWRRMLPALIADRRDMKRKARLSSFRMARHLRLHMRIARAALNHQKRRIDAITQSTPSHPL